MKNNIKKGDEIVVIAGNAKGERANVLQVFPQKNRVLIEGVNKRTHHEKPNQDEMQQGVTEKRTEREVPIHLSNVMLASRWDERQKSKNAKS